MTLTPFISGAVSEGKRKVAGQMTPICRRKLLEHILREDVQAELSVGVGAGVEDLMVNHGDRD